MSISGSLGVPATTTCPQQPCISLLLVPLDVFSSVVHSPDHKGYHYLDPTTNHIVISRHVMFHEAYFPFAASPHPTNDYEFLPEMDPVFSPIRTRLSAGTSATTAAGLTVPLGGRTAPIAEVGGLTAPLGSPTVDSVAPPGGLTA
jgi:hypothetical protein